MVQEENVCVDGLWPLAAKILEQNEQHRVNSLNRQVHYIIENDFSLWPLPTSLLFDQMREGHIFYNIH
jgi:hypothetical protein